MERTPKILSGTIFRAYSPRGVYWDREFLSSSASCSMDGGLIWTAVHFDDTQHEGRSYSEFDSIKLEEIRLLSAIFLALSQYTHGIACYYPLERTYVSPVLSDLSSGKISEEAKSCLSQPHKYFEKFESPYAFDGGLAIKDVYATKTEVAEPDRFLEILQKVDLQNHTLMRGLASLLKASMLVQHPFFNEIALVSLYISLDASHSLVKTAMEAEGYSDTGPHQTQRYIETLVGEPYSGIKYFEGFYRNRIMAIHPKSTFGTAPYTPGSMSDYYHLSYGLQEVYRTLILKGKCAL